MLLLVMINKIVKNNSFHETHFPHLKKFCTLFTQVI